MKQGLVYLLLGTLGVSTCGKEEQTSTNSSKETVHDLFVYEPNSRIDPPYDDPVIVDVHKVQVRRELLDADNIETITLNLFDGVCYDVQKEKKEDCQERHSLCREGEYLWIGTILNSAFAPGLSDASVTFVVTNNSIGGAIRETPWNLYSYFLGGSPHGLVLTKIDPTKFPPEAYIDPKTGETVIER